MKRLSEDLGREAVRIRKQAVEKMKDCEADKKTPLKSAETKKLIYELELNRIALEMQNQELRQARAELAESLDKYAELFEFAPVGYFTLDSEGVILQVNLAGATLVGKERSQMIQRKLSVFIYGENRSAFTFFLMKAMKTFGTELETAIETEHAGKVFVRLKACPSNNEQECHLTMTDITAQKKAEAALVYSEMRYRALMHESSDAIALVDIETKKVLEVNQNMLRMVGYTAEEVYNMTTYDFVAEPRPELERGYQELIRQIGVGVPSTVRRIRRKDGQFIEVERSAAVVNFGDRKAFLFSCRDLSAQRKLQEQVLRDVELAAQVQKSLIPTGFDDLLISVKTIFAPFHLVSGDYLDYGWSADQQRFCGFVIDVSGHGVASSLQGIAVSTYFRDVLYSTMGLDAKLKWINQQVAHYFSDDTYAAALLFEFDFERKVLHIANAGIYGFLCSSHALPPIVRKPGSLIGVTESAEYTAFSVPLVPGEQYFFMSDGIFEQVCENENLDVKHFEQTIAIMREAAASRACHDDCSAICIQVKGPIAFPVTLQILRFADYNRIRARLRELIQRIAAEDEAGKVLVALGEAMNNAGAESVEVRVKVSLFGRLLVIRVRDGGNGFDGRDRVKKLRNRPISESFESVLHAEDGRGILVMFAWMDQVIYNRTGNEVTLVKRLAVRPDKGQC